VDERNFTGFARFRKSRFADVPPAVTVPLPPELRREKRPSAGLVGELRDDPQTPLVPRALMAIEGHLPRARNPGMAFSGG